LGTVARSRCASSGFTLTRTSSARPVDPWKIAVETWPSELPEIRAMLPPWRRLRVAQRLTQATLAIFGVSTKVTPPADEDDPEAVAAAGSAAHAANKATRTDVARPKGTGSYCLSFCAAYGVS
jgi:hypothetical protein